MRKYILIPKADFITISEDTKEQFKKLMKWNDEDFLKNTFEIVPQSETRKRIAKENKERVKKAY